MGAVIPFEDRRRRPAMAPGDELDGVPPAHDLGTEGALLSAALLVPLGDDERAKRQRACLEAAHDVIAEGGAAAVFFNPNNGRIYEAIAWLRARSTPVAADTVAARLREAGHYDRVGGIERLGDLLTRATEPGTVEVHARRLVDLRERREIAAACLLVQAQARAGVEDHEAWKADARRALGRVTAPRPALKGRMLGAVTADVRAHVDELVRGEVLGVRWGLRQLDERLGLITTGRHHVLAGESEHGKTALGWQIGESVAATPPDATGVREAVYFLSGEMPGSDLVLRAACAAAGIDVQRLEVGAVTADEMRLLGEWIGWYAKLPLVIDDDPAPAGEIARRVRAHRETFGAGKARDGNGDLFVDAEGKPQRFRLRLVIGDHLSTLADTAHGLDGRADLRARIAAVSAGWKGMAHAKGGPATLLLAQLHGGDRGERKRDSSGAIPWPTVYDLWGGNAVRADADRVIAVCRPELYLRGKAAAPWRDVSVVYPLKGRFGGSRRKIKIGFTGGRFTEVLPATATTHDDEE